MRKYAEIKEDKERFFKKAPTQVLNFNLHPMLDPKTAAIVSSCSHSLYQNISSDKSYWRNPLIEMGCNKEIINKIMHTNAIKNYKKLYANLLHIKYKFRIELETWELCCLSGEPHAIHYAIQNEKLTQETEGFSGRRALHYAALSGSVNAIRYVIETLNIPVECTDNVRANVLHFAAKSGSIDAIGYAIETLKIPTESIDRDESNILHYALQSCSVEAVKYVIKNSKISKTSTDQNEMNALHFASGSAATMRYAIEILKIPKKNLDKHGLNVLHHAAWRGVVSAMQYAVETLKIPAQSTDKFGGNALHYAAFSGSVDAMRYAIETLHISPTSIEKSGLNILHNAAWSGCPNAVRFVRILSHELQLKLDPSVQANGGYDAFWYAEKTARKEAVKEILNMPIQELLKHAPHKMIELQMDPDGTKRRRVI